MSRVVLQRDEPGKYTVYLTDPYEPTPLLVRRVRDRWGGFWQVVFKGTAKLSEIAGWKERLTPGAWDVTFGSVSEGFDTLREARLKLEEVVSEGSGSSERDAGREAAGEHLGGDTAGSTRAG